MKEAKGSESKVAGICNTELGKAYYLGLRKRAKKACVENDLALALAICSHGIKCLLERPRGKEEAEWLARLSLRRAKAYMLMKENDQAVLDADMALVEAPNLVEGYGLKGSALAASKQYPKALDCLRAGSQRFPGSVPLKQLFMKTLEGLGRSRHQYSGKSLLSQSKLYLDLSDFFEAERLLVGKYKVYQGIDFDKECASVLTYFEQEKEKLYHIFNTFSTAEAKANAGATPSRMMEEQFWSFFSISGIESDDFGDAPFQEVWQRISPNRRRRQQQQQEERRTNFPKFLEGTTRLLLSRFQPKLKHQGGEFVRIKYTLISDRVEFLFSRFVTNNSDVGDFLAGVGAFYDEGKAAIRDLAASMAEGPKDSIAIGLLAAFESERQGGSFKVCCLVNMLERSKYISNSNGKLDTVVSVALGVTRAFDESATIELPVFLEILAGIADLETRDGIQDLHKRFRVFVSKYIIFPLAPWS